MGRGLLHVHQGRTDTYSQADGLSGDNVLSLFEDREGNIWAATYVGLDRFCELPVFTISAKQGLSGDAPSAVLAGRDGSVWAAGRNGLDRWRDGTVRTFRKSDGLPDDSVQSLYEDSVGRIWLFSNHGLVYREDGRFVPVRGVPDGYVSSIAGDKAGNLWLAKQEQGLVHLAGGKLIETIPWARLGRKNPDNAVVLLGESAGSGRGDCSGGE